MRVEYGHREPLESGIIQASRPCKRQITRSSGDRSGFFIRTPPAGAVNPQSRQFLGRGQRVFQAVGNMGLLGGFKIGMHWQGQHMIA